MFLACARARFRPLLLAVRRIIRFFHGRGRAARLSNGLRFVFDPNVIRQHGAIELRPQYATIRGLWGEKLRVDLNEHVGWRTFLDSYFDIVPLCLAPFFLSRRGGVYIDVGANIGATSIALATRGYKVLGIEASPRILSDLSFNVALNSPIPYTVAHAAVAETVPPFGQQYVEIYSASGNSGATSLRRSWNTDSCGARVEFTHQTTLDRVVESLQIERIGFVKVDIEGLEFEAVRGFRRTLEKTAPPLLFEWLPDAADRRGLPLKDIRLAFPSNYMFFGIRHSGGPFRSGETVPLEFCDFAIRESYENVLAVAEDFLKSDCATPLPKKVLMPL